MNFKKVFRGYDPAQVDKYITETAAKEQQIRTAQKERIDELSDENYSLRQQLKQYETDEQAISKSLIASQHLAEELKFDAEKYSELVLSRAKIFYATWRAYSQTFIASLSPDEVEQFNKLQKRIEDVINAYEGNDVAREMDEHKAQHDEAAASVSKATAKPAQRKLTEEDIIQEYKTVDVTPSETTMGMYANPIKKVEEAANQVIDLRELTKVDMSLEELCEELGLTVKKE